MEKVLSPRRRLSQICEACERAWAGDGERPRKKQRTEVVFRQLLFAEVGFLPSSVDEALYKKGGRCDDLPRRRPDICWLTKSVAIVVEIAEDSHQKYDVGDEIAKVSQQNEAIQLSDGFENIPVYTLRVNPDVFDRERVTKKRRADVVAER